MTMAIERTEYGATVLTGEHINLFRLRMVYQGLKLQAETGMKLSGKFSTTKVARSMGFKGRTAKALLADMEKKYPMLVRHPNVEEN
jgi:hypothetical protein